MKLSPGSTGIILAVLTCACCVRNADAQFNALSPVFSRLTGGLIWGSLGFRDVQNPERIVLADPHPAVRGGFARQLLASAISNLLQNAFKLTRPSGHVWLRTSGAGDRVLIEVEGGCGGLPPGTSERVGSFERRHAERLGLGLGLMISRQAIEASGGKLSSRDIPGRTSDTGTAVVPTDQCNDSGWGQVGPAPDRVKTRRES